MVRGAQCVDLRPGSPRRRHHDQSDSIVNALDEARGTQNLSKAALARAVGSDPSTVRRLMSSESVNPTLGTIAEVAAALGLTVILTPMSADDRTRITEPMGACV